MGSDFKSVVDRADFLKRAKLVVETLAKLSKADFYDETTDNYHPVRNEIAHLIWSIQSNIEGFRNFLAANPGPERGLPADLTELQTMPLDEVIFRIQGSISTERWIDGVLVEPFERGVLLNAIQRIVENFDAVLLKPCE
jgi:hypothetical protein